MNQHTTYLDSRDHSSGCFLVFQIALGTAIGILITAVCVIGVCKMALDRQVEEINKREQQRAPSIRSR